MEKYNAQLAEARGEAAKIREDAKTQGSQILADMREQAHAESARIRAAAESQLQAERAQVVARCAARSAGWPRRWPAGSSASRSRTTSALAAPSTGSSLSSRPSPAAAKSRLPQAPRERGRATLERQRRKRASRHDEDELSKSEEARISSLDASSTRLRTATRSPASCSVWWTRWILAMLRRVADRPERRRR